MSDPDRLNIAQRLTDISQRYPDHVAVIVANRHGESTRRVSFEDFESLTRQLTLGLQQQGLQPGQRIVLMVRPGIEFLALVFALFRAGAIVVLIDPGMGLHPMVDCLEEINPHGFVAISKVQWVRWFYRRRFSHARLNVRVGGWAPACLSYQSLLVPTDGSLKPVATASTDTAAIIFTSGSTGPAKGVEYEHGMFDAQVNLLQDRFQIEAGERDLPAFPLFALFNAAMGVTTVFPDIDPTRPAHVDPRRIIAPIRKQQVTQSFGSPALWKRVGRYCLDNNLQLPSLKRALAAGAPVPPPIIESVRHALEESGGDLFTPYGATEALPISVISGDEVLKDTVASSRLGQGTCVGRLFSQVEATVIEITDDDIPTYDHCQPLSQGEIGEIIVRGPSVTRRYFQRPAATASAKIADGDRFWHRMGDVGFFDESGRLWFCGRKTHRVETRGGTLFSVPCESIFNEHPAVSRSALVGLGPRPQQRPVIIVELENEATPGPSLVEIRAELLELAAGSPLTLSVTTLLFHPSLPVDIRHNVKINREALAEWAMQRISDSRQSGSGDE